LHTLASLYIAVEGFNCTQEFAQASPAQVEGKTMHTHINKLSGLPKQNWVVNTWR